MFRAVRGYFGDGRGKHIARLFVFELTVVTLGVLIAQWVQGVAQERSARMHMEDERARVRMELARFHESAVEWLAAIPCLDQRATQIMAGRLPADATLARPALNVPTYSPPDDESLILMDKQFGHRETSVMRGMAMNVANLHNVSTKIIDDWGRFALLDPANGTVSPSDRTEARVAAADIKAELHSATIINNDTASRLSSIGIGMAEFEHSGRGVAHSCDAIWRSGQIDPPLTMR